MKIVLVLLLLLPLSAACYYLYLRFSAIAEVRLAPRSKMFFCDKHGFISPEHLISFIDVKHCPLCYHETLLAQEKI